MSAHTNVENTRLTLHIPTMRILLRWAQHQLFAPLVAAVRQKAKSAPEALARLGIAVELEAACPTLTCPGEQRLTAGVTCTVSAKFRVDAELHDEALAVL